MTGEAKQARVVRVAHPGNGAFAREQNELAVLCYSAALEQNEAAQHGGAGAAPAAELTLARRALLSNRSSTSSAYGQGIIYVFQPMI